MRKLFYLFLLFGVQLLSAQLWEEDNSIFNPSGIPSLTFSQPRFADLDGDGDFDFLLGNTNRSPLFIENTGTAASPVFIIGDDYLSGVSSLQSEMAVCADIDADGDLDLITGGYTGLHLFLNIGSVTAPLFQESVNYFAGLMVGSNPVPDLADVDHDLDLDLLVGLSEDGSVRIYTNIGSPANGQYSESNLLVIADVGLYAYPVFCDFDNDDDQDILVGRDSHGFAYYQNTGNSSVGNWQVNTTYFANLGSGTYFNSPDLVDLNNDGLHDLIFGSGTGPLQYYMNTGTAVTPVWQLNATLFGGVIDVGGASSPAFFDFDYDGDLDMISGSQLGTIKYFENTGTPFGPAWSQDSAYFVSIDHSIYAAVTIGDVNGDSLPDALIGDLNGGLYYHRNTGTGFEQVNGVLDFVALGGWSVPRLIDMEGDGDLDLVAGNEAGNLRYYENLGTQTIPDWVEVAGYFGTIDVGSNCVPALGDIDLDGDMDLIAGNMFGNVRCFLRRGTGWTENTTLFNGIVTDQNAAPALVDLDHDGDLDLVLGDYDGTLKYYRNLTYSNAVLNPPFSLLAGIISNQATLSWNPPATGSTSPFQHYNIYLNGVFVASTNAFNYILNDLIIGVVYTVSVSAQYIAGESMPAQLEFQITGNDDNLQIPIVMQNWPNPFHSTTTIRFSVKTNDTAFLDIFNVRGQRVKSWKGFTKGVHNVVWDRKDEKGCPVSSGIYFYRLQSPGETKVRKMILQ